MKIEENINRMPQCSRKYKCCVAIFELTLLCCINATTAVAVDFEKKYPEDMTIDDKVIEKHNEISRELESATEKIDIYVANKKLVDEPNRSKFIIYNNFSIKESGERTYAPHVGVHLHLPNLQKKLRLNFTTYDEDAASRGINKNRYQSTPTETLYGGSFSLFQQLGNLKTEFRPLVEYIRKVQTSYLFRFWSEATRGDFTIEPEAQVFARSDTGTGQYAGLNFGFHINNVNDLTLINEEQYADGDNTMSTNHGIRLNHQFTDKMLGETALIFESNNRPSYHLERYVYRATFEHHIRPEILHYSLTPYLTFDKENDFHARMATDLQVQIIF